MDVTVPTCISLLLRICDYERVFCLLVSDHGEKVHSTLLLARQREFKSHQLPDVFVLWVEQITYESLCFYK